MDVIPFPDPINIISSKSWISSIEISLRLILIFLLEPRFNSAELTGIYIGLGLIWFGFFEYLKKY